MTMPDQQEPDFREMAGFFQRRIGDIQMGHEHDLFQLQKQLSELQQQNQQLQASLQSLQAGKKTKATDE